MVNLNIQKVINTRKNEQSIEKQSKNTKRKSHADTHTPIHTYTSTNAQ